MAGLHNLPARSIYTLTTVFQDGAVKHETMAGTNARWLAINTLAFYRSARTVTASNGLNTDVYIAQRDKEGKVI